MPNDAGQPQQARLNVGHVGALAMAYGPSETSNVHGVEVERRLRIMLGYFES